MLVAAAPGDGALQSRDSGPALQSRPPRLQYDTVARTIHTGLVQLATVTHHTSHSDLQ